jgi:hypothetical protein
LRRLTGTPTFSADALQLETTHTLEAAMGRINMSRVVLGGLLAGLVITISEALLNMVVLSGQMAEAMKALNLPPDIGVGAIAVFVLVGFVLGIVMVWMYAAMRPRLGPGPQTATIVALITWFLAYLYSSIGMAAMHIFPTGMITIGVVWGLVELIVAANLGARFYSE